MTKTQTDLEKTRENAELEKKNKMQTLADLLRTPETKAKLLEGAPKFFNEDALIRVAISAIQRTPKLLECTTNSIITALINCAYYGLCPESQTNEAHLVPFKNTCVLITGYQGLIKMATNSGVVSHVEVSHVYKNDTFYVQKGTDKLINHIPAEGDPGSYIGSYCVVVYASGNKDFEYLTKEQGLAHGKRFSKTFTFKDSPWQIDIPSMVLKTAVRMIMKFVPKSPQSERLHIAIAKEELMEAKGYIDIEPGVPREEISDPKPLDAEVPDNVDPETGEEIPEWLLKGEPDPSKAPDISK